jgi:hypothetical protein
MPIAGLWLMSETNRRRHRQANTLPACLYGMKNEALPSQNLSDLFADQ